MKFTSVIALVAVVAARHQREKEPEVEVIEDDDVWSAEDLAAYRVAAFKGLHEGFDKAFYKTRTIDANCLNDDTVKNIGVFGRVVKHPMASISGATDIAGDFNLFAEAAEIMENFSGCHFEGPIVEILQYCTADPEVCEISALLANLKKNLFVLVGKLTSLAETLKDWPAETIEDNHDIFMEFGDDLGTVVRTIFNYHGKHEKSSHSRHMMY